MTEKEDLKLLEELRERKKPDEDNESEDTEDDDDRFLEKLALVAKAGLWGSIIGSALTAGAFWYASAHDLFGTKDNLEQARAEAIRTIEIREEYVRDLENSVNSDKEGVEEEKEKLMEKEWQLRSREVVVNGEKQNIETERGYLKSETDKLREICEELKRDNEFLGLEKAKVKAEKEINKLREEFLDKREKEAEEIEKRVLNKVIERADNCLAYILSFDHNRNYVLDDIDSQISEKFLGNISVLSQEYLSSVRYIHNPVVLKKLEQYGIKGPVISVNDKFILISKDDTIEKTIENVPEESLYDFEFNPQGSDGISEIISNRKPGKASPITIRNPAKTRGGSGFVLGNKYIATAYHVVEALEDEFIITLEDGKEMKASKKSVIASSKEHDIAVIRADFDGYAPAVLQEDLRIGQKMRLKRAQSNMNIAKGDTAEGYLYCNECVGFNSYINTEDENSPPEIHGTDTYLSTIQAFHGDSGSPVLNDDGDVVGIAVGAYKNKNGSINTIKIKYLKKLLEQYSKKCE